MDREQLVLSIANILSARASALGALKALLGDEAYEAENEVRKAFQHFEWQGGGRVRWRATMTRLKLDHYTQCAMFLLEHGIEPEVAGPVDREYWLQGLELLDGDAPPVPHQDVYEESA